MVEEPLREFLERLHSLKLVGGVPAEPCAGGGKEQDRHGVLQECLPFTLAQCFAEGLLVACDELSDPAPWDGFWIAGQLTAVGEDAASQELGDVVDARSLGRDAEVEVDRLAIG